MIKLIIVGILVLIATVTGQESLSANIPSGSESIADSLLSNLTLRCCVVQSLVSKKSLRDANTNCSSAANSTNCTSIEPATTPLDCVNLTNSCLDFEPVHQVYITQPMTYYEAVMCCRKNFPRLIDKCIYTRVRQVLKYLNISQCWYPTLGTKIPGDHYSLLPFCDDNGGESSSLAAASASTAKKCVLINQAGTNAKSYCSALKRLVCF